MESEILFKLSNVYNKENVVFDNSIGEELLEKIIFNRVLGIAYKNLKHNSATQEYAKSLEAIFERDIQEVEKYEKSVEYVSKIFEGAQFKYAFLKGAFLITKIYEKGLRKSNDIDVLVEEDNVEECQKLLFKYGFVQGSVRDGKIIQASRNDIIRSKMNYGETVQFCKFHEGRAIFVDINFSLDYKPMENKNIICKMLNESVNISFGDGYLITLNSVDFVIHLCVHLFKEATTFDWVRRCKDLSLYKFSDLNVMFHEYIKDDLYDKLTNRIVEFGLERECYFSLLYTSYIYKDLKEILGFETLINRIKPKKLDYLTQVINPVEKKIYCHNMDFVDWFNCSDRADFLVKRDNT